MKPAPATHHTDTIRKDPTGVVVTQKNQSNLITQDPARFLRTQQRASATPLLSSAFHASPEGAVLDSSFRKLMPNGQCSTFRSTAA